MTQTLIPIAATIALIAIAIATAILAVRRDGRGADDLIKRLIIWVAIAALLPLTSYAGATLLHPRTKLDDLLALQLRVQQETYDTREVANREKSRDQGEELRKQVEVEERAFYRAMFWVACPIGFSSLVVGLFLRAVPVGIGLAFGGLCTLTTGCYSYWNAMGDALRFSSLLIVLVTVIAIGLVRFGQASGDPRHQVPDPSTR